MQRNACQSRWCGDCGEPGEANARFCTRCGCRLPVGGMRDLAAPEESGIWVRTPPAARRRQLTLLFCDLVGSSELPSQADPEDLCSVLRVYQTVCAAAIARFGGRVARAFDDGLLVCFGEASEADHAQLAVQAGLAIIAAVADPNGGMRRQGMHCAVRIGIHTDWVVPHPDLAVAGDAASTAARLQQLAEPNQLVVGPTTFESIAGYFRVLKLGPQPITSVRQPIPVWRVLHKAGQASHARA
jgi:class 3 adenylate cyclase